jgi:hypothetical protein
MNRSGRWRWFGELFCGRRRYGFDGWRTELRPEIPGTAGKPSNNEQQNQPDSVGPVHCSTAAMCVSIIMCGVAPCMSGLYRLTRQVHPHFIVRQVFDVCSQIP